MLEHPISRAVIISCLTAAILAVWKLYLWPLPGKIRDHLARTIQDVVRCETQEIKSELHPNGGSSLRDAVDRLGKGQSSISTALSTLNFKQWAMLGFHDEDRGWFETDANGQLQRLSSQILRWVGRSMEELTGDRWRSIIEPSMRETAFSWWHATWSSGSYGDMEQVYVTADGGKLRVLVHATPVFDEERRLIAYVGTVTRLGRVEH